MVLLVSNSGSVIDYYGVTFDHLITPDNDFNPEVLQISISEIDSDNGLYVNTWLLFPVDSAEYFGKKILAVPRCCHKRKGTQDRWRINALVDQRTHGRDRMKGPEEFTVEAEDTENND